MYVLEILNAHFLVLTKALTRQYLCLLLIAVFWRPRACHVKFGPPLVYNPM